MKNKKIYFLVLLILVCILSISAISATENTTNKEIINTNNKETNLQTNIQYDEVLTNKENFEIKLEEKNNNDNQDKSRTDETTTDNEDPLTFTDLNTTINSNTNSTIYLYNNYKFNKASDSKLENGIDIDRNLTIYGNGVTINGNKMARIFNVIDSKLNVNFYNINFINGNSSDEGGAIVGGNAYNCTFTENKAKHFGGAMRGGNAYNCTFTKNSAYDGGAMYDGNVYNCTFIENSAEEDGGAMSYGNATNCTFISNTAYFGGAIRSVEATFCIFSDNNAEYGGAITKSNAYNCIFNENKANKSGGAISESNATNSTFTKNEAADGGAISESNATNCNFTANTALQHGGAIYQGNAYNCIFTGNNANGGGAISESNATNCRFVDNTAADGGAIHSGNVYYCTFTNNTADYGGTILNGNAYNCIFTGNTAKEMGGALHLSNASNCTFTNNTAKEMGGAIYQGNAYNCTFTGNNATEGGAIYKGSAILCRFNGDTTYETNIIPAIINVLNYTSTYQSGDRLIFNLTADNMLLDGFNTTIKIYKGEELVTTVYGLTGEGAIIDLDPGEYTAVLSLTDYPDEQPSNATITVLKENTIVNITPITDVVVGKEITITYTTNSNGTATIKVNGQPITEGKFTPTKEGTYNVIVELEENDYYTAGSNQTTFTAKKSKSNIIASPVSTTYNIGKYLLITLKDGNGNPIRGAVLTVKLANSKKYTTNANGQVKINVGTLTPKTYNAKITYAGSDIFNPSTASVKVTVKKAKPKITAKSTIIKYRLKTKKYTATFKNNKNKAIKNTKVSLKVNGKTYNVKTNKKGQGIFKITNLRKIGYYIAVITFPANKYYNKVSKKVKIIVRI